MTKRRFIPEQIPEPEAGKMRPLSLPKADFSITKRRLQCSRRLTILVVEDHGSLCDMVSLFFMRHGYHVRTASDGNSAIQICASETIHLILLDLMLPRVDGFRVLREIRKLAPEKRPYVIVVSAGSSKQNQRLAFNLGADEYLRKPFQLAYLLQRVQSVERILLA
jgi:DNA-binding response OmpR family regulator